MYFDPNKSSFKTDLNHEKQEQIHEGVMMFETSSCQLIEENRPSIIGEGFSEQLFEDLLKVAESYDKLR